jgi:hypothetical protein
VYSVYRWWATLVFAAVVVQVGAAGYGAFDAASNTDPGPLTNAEFENGFDFHNGLGYLIFIGAAILFLLSLAVHRGRRQVLEGLAAPVLVAIQIILGVAGEDHAVIGIFHPVVALVIAGLTGSLAFRAWRAA